MSALSHMTYDSILRLDDAQIRLDADAFGFDAQLCEHLMASMGIRSPRTNRMRMDAGESLSFQRQLLFVMTQIHEVKYPELMARQIIPVNNAVNPGAEAFAWHLYDSTGIAKVIDDDADDIPTVETQGAEQINSIKTIGVGFGWNVQQLAAATFSGIPLSTRKALAARMSFERAVEQIAGLGVTGANLPGAFKVSGVPLITSGITGAWTGGTTTPAQIIADLNYIANYAARTTGNAFTVDTMALPLAQLQYISSTPASATIPDKSILQVFLAQSLYVKKVVGWDLLKNANASNNGPRAWCYRSNSDTIELVIPQEFQTLPPQQKNFKFWFPCRGRIAGVVVYEPLGMVYADGI